MKRVLAVTLAIAGISTTPAVAADKTMRQLAFCKVFYDALESPKEDLALSALFDRAEVAGVRPEAVSIMMFDARADLKGLRDGAWVRGHNKRCNDLLKDAGK